VIVSRDEREALDRVLLALRSGRAVVPPAPDLIDETTGQLKPLAAISPLVVEPLPGTPVGDGSGRRNR